MTHFYLLEPDEIVIKSTINEIKKRVFFSTDEEVDFSDIVKIMDTDYSLCYGNKENGEQYYGVRKIEWKDDINDLIEDEVTCPYCGYSQESFEMADSDDHYICDHCKSEFSYEKVVNVDYWSYALNKNTDIKVLK